MNDEGGAPTPARVRRCPICGKPRQFAYAPFCSKRCADVDLARWLNGSYAIPSAEEQNPPEPSEPSRPPEA